MKNWFFGLLVVLSIGFGYLGVSKLSQPSEKKSSLTVQVLQGQEIAPYSQEITEFVNKVYKSAPYFYDGKDTGYASYLSSFHTLDEAIVCLAFEKKEIVGIAVGLPMPNRQVYQDTLSKQGYNLSQLFYLGEFGLKPEHHGKGIEKTMYEKIANFAQESGKFTQLCFWEVEGAAEDQQRGYCPTEEFWKEIGFTRHPELNFQIYWTNIGEEKESAHKAVYWLKD